MDTERDNGICGRTAKGSVPDTFVVFDVETPNRLNDRISAVGITVVRSGEIKEEFYSLADPEEPFDRFNTLLTGIDAGTVRGAPAFPQLWPRIRPYLDSGILAAHNAVFDLGVLRKCLRDHHIIWKESVPYVCTVQMGRRLLPGMSHRLNILCDHYGIELDHHQALSDSRACAQILLRYMREGADVDRFIRTFRIGD
ncbi:MAG: 3'-5' exonuclease [Clostridia bacterium]|nr:3'-5' exonuclease [Clostridia bacterium]